MSRFCFVYTIGFVLRDPKLNYVQLPGFVEKRAKYLIVRRQVVLKRSAVFYFCLARHKIEQSSISLVCAGLLQEKSPLDKLPIRTIQKNLPVGDFSAVEPNPPPRRAKRFFG